MIHKLKNITYNLVKLEKALVFEVLKQNKIWTIKECSSDKDKPHCFEFFSSNGIEVSSFLYPSLEGDRGRIQYIFLWGSDKQKKNHIKTFKFESGKQRDIDYNKIIQALKEWDLHVEQLKEMEDDK